MPHIEFHDLLRLHRKYQTEYIECTIAAAFCNTDTMRIRTACETKLFPNLHAVIVSDFKTLVYYFFTYFEAE